MWIQSDQRFSSYYVYKRLLTDGRAYKKKESEREETARRKTNQEKTQIDWLIDGFYGMSTHLGHVMPKRTMLKFLEKNASFI